MRLGECWAAPLPFGRKDRDRRVGPAQTAFPTTLELRDLCRTWKTWTCIVRPPGRTYRRTSARTTRSPVGKGSAARNNPRCLKGLCPALSPRAGATAGSCFRFQTSPPSRSAGDERVEKIVVRVHKRNWSPTTAERVERPQDHGEPRRVARVQFGSPSVGYRGSPTARRPWPAVRRESGKTIPQPRRPDQSPSRNDLLRRGIKRGSPSGVIAPTEGTSQDTLDFPESAGTLQPASERRPSWAELRADHAEQNKLS